MKKTEKLSILISIVLISLLAISAVSAAETDDTPLTQTSNDGAVSEPSTTDVQVKDTQDTTTTKESSSTDTVKATEPGTFTDLNNDINKPFETEPNTNTINLTKDYKYDAEKDTGLDNGITFSTSELNLHTITVDGKGHTISGEGEASIFQIVYKNMDVTLKNLIIENARSDFAAINVNKDTKLTLINVTFTGNQGTSVIENNGTLTIEDSTFDGNSYNIYSLGGLSSTLSTWDVIIKNTTFTNNYGIATFVNSSVKIINSTFYHNWNGIEAVNSSLTIEDTIFNATGGLGIEDSDLVMNTVKFVELNMDEQTAIEAYTCGILMNDVEFIRGNYAIEAYNSTIESHNSKFINNTQDAITTAISELKIFDGLFEGNDEAILLMLSNATIVGTNFTDNGNGEEDYGDTAIGGFNSNINLAEVMFINNTYGAIELLNGNLTIKDTDFINSTADEAITAVLANITVTGAKFENNTLGAIDLHNGILDISGVTVFKSNKDSAIFAKDANVTVTGAKFEGNQADSLFDDDDANGGAINIENGNLKITNTEFTNNTATNNAGAIYIKNGNLTVTGSNFTNNTAEKEQGGAIYKEGTGNTKIVKSIFTNNKVTASNKAGGAIYNNVNGNITIETSTFEGNYANSHGGAVFTKDNATIIGSNFTNNSANNGGAISTYTSQPKIIIEDSKFTNNIATQNGGAIYNNGLVNITESEFNKNKASNGGAIYNNGKIDIEDGTFTNNIATQDGGAIYNDALGANEINEDPAIKILYTDFKNNNANRNGAEIYTRHPNEGEYYHHTKSIRITDSTISNNIATNKNNLLYCTIENGAISYACIELNNVDIYTQIVTYNATILNNVTDKVVLFFKINEEGTNKPLFDNLTIFVDNILYTDAMSYEPYLIEGLTPDIHIINVVYGGTPYNYELGYDEIVINVTESVATLQEKLANATRNASELDKQLKDAQKQVTNLTEQLANATRNASELDKQLKDAQKQVADLTAQLNTANAEITTTKAALDNANSQITTLTSQLTAANKKADDANAKIKKVKAKSKIKKSKKFKVTVTLSKKISGKYVYVIFNGKSYKAKAKNGVAKITIKKSALKKLGGKKIKYQIVYNQSLKNKTVKIKK